MGRRLFVAVVGLAGLVGAPLAFVAVTSVPAGAGTGCAASNTTVTSSADTSTSGTLRTAITNANFNIGAQNICIDTTLVTTPIVLGSDLPGYNGTASHVAPLTIDGNGATLNGSGHAAIQSTSGGPVTIDSFTITGAHNAGLGGGGIFAAAAVTLTNSTVTNNTALTGGGIGTFGAVTLTNSSVTGNTVSGFFGFGGGGILAFGAAVTATNSTVTNNTASSGSGGGIENGGALTLTNSTVTNNVGDGIADNGAGVVTLTNSVVSNNMANTTGHGTGVDVGCCPAGSITLANSTVNNNTAGGIFTIVPLTLVNSTVAGNTASLGGGIEDDGPNGVTLVNSTVANNAGGVGGGINASIKGAPLNLNLVYSTVVQNSASSGGANVNSQNPGGTLTSFGSVIAQPAGGGPNCGPGGSTTSKGYNFSDDASCGFTSTGDTQNGRDPRLDSLANNGGPTPTMLPDPGSPLVNEIPNDSCQAGAGITTDQRGFPRPDTLHGRCDIGAVELDFGRAPT